MAGVALIISAMFLLLLHQMNRRDQRSSKMRDTLGKEPKQRAGQDDGGTISVADG